MVATWVSVDVVSSVAFPALCTNLASTTYLWRAVTYVYRALCRATRRGIYCHYFMFAAKIKANE